MSTTKKKRGGVIHISSLFKDEANKRHIQRALQERPETFNHGMRAELERYSIDPLKAASEDIGQLLNQRATFRQGRPETAATTHIRQLAAANPKLKPAALYELRDRLIIKSMSKGSWRTRVAEARRK